MSSPGFRQAVMQALAAQWTRCPVFDLSDYVSVEDLPASSTDPVLLVQFIGGPENVVTIATEGNHGWREDGTAYLHLLMPTGESSGKALQWGEELRHMFRGKRFGSYVVDAMEPFTDFAGAAIRVNGKWHGWSSALAYTNTICA